MLKRYQIMLQEWQMEHIRSQAEANDLSFSEIIRQKINTAILGDEKADKLLMNNDYDRLEFEARKEIEKNG